VALQKLKAIGWAFSLAWRFNKVVLVGWLVLVAVVSILPAIALHFNREIIDGLNVFVATGDGLFGDILPLIIVFGIITVLIGLSNRINSDMLYQVLQHSYRFAMAELINDSVQKCTTEELLKREASSEIFGVAIHRNSILYLLADLFSLFGNVVSTVSLLFIAFSLSQSALIFAVIYLAVIITVNMRFVKKLRSTRYKVRDMERLAGHYEEMAFSQEFAKELRVFKSRGTLLKNWRKAYAPIYDIHIKNTAAFELRSLANSVVFYVFLTAIIIYMLSLVSRGDLAAANLLVIYTLCLNVRSVSEGIAHSIRDSDGALHYVEQQRAFVKKTEGRSMPSVTAEHDIETDEAAPLFRTEDLVYSYNDDKIVLDGISIEINKGEIIALVGLNGSGKSTLVGNLMQLYKPKSGKRFYQGVDYDELDPGFMKDRTGVFFQQYYKFHVPIWEYVGYGDINNVDDMPNIKRALEKGGAMGFVMKLPLGLDSFNGKTVEKAGVEFSGGERQKLAVSRAHMSNKQILVFDEPASMLDPIAELEQFTHIKEKLEGNTAILISHRVGFARLADRIIVLDGGKVAEVGTHNDLMKREGLYAEFFNEQAQWYKA